MTKEELKQAYIHGNLSKGVVHCDKTSVSAGLEKLQELIALSEKADENSTSAINNLHNLTGFYGVVKNNCLAEDNLLYDLDIPSYGGSNTEDIVDDFKKDTEELKTLLTSLKKDIEATVSAIDVYNNRDAYSPGQLAAAAEGISLFDDYARLGDYANKYTLDQFNGNGGSGNKVNGYSGGGGSKTKIDDSAFDKKEISPIPTHSPTPITTNPTPTKTTTNPIPTTTKSVDPNPTPTPTITPAPTKTTTKTNPIPDNPDPEYVPPVGPDPVSTKPGGGRDFGDDKDKDTDGKFKSADGKGTLASSITTANLRKDKVKKIDKPINSTGAAVQNNYVIPTAAALSASAAAGIGTKAYIDYSNNSWRKEDDDDDDEEKKDEIESEEWNGSEDDMNVEYGIKDSTEIIEELEDDGEKPSDNFNFVD